MRLKVEPDVIALSPGDVTDLLVRVHNDGGEACTPYLQVRGLDPDDVLLPDEVVAVPAGSVMTAVVRVRAAADAVPGDQRIAVAAEDLDGGQGTVSATTVLRIGARPDVAVEVDPVATAGRRGAKASTILRNRSDRRLQVDLEGRGEGVLVSFRPSRITLDPGETKRVRTRMRRAQRSWFGEIRHGAVITARGIGAPASTTATFTQKPSVPRPAVRGVAALTALAVWVAATVVVFNRINAEPEAGPDTGAVAAPAAPGPGRTSATGMFVDEEDEGISLPVVIQGTIEGPRDPAGTTVTAERIGFGDQGTTSGFTKVVALAEVKLPRGNVLDVVRTNTDERGRFRIASGLVEDAFYRVTAVRAGFEVGSFIVSTSPDEPEVTLAIALEPASGSLAGTVTDADGEPVGGASVLVTDGSAEYTTVTPAEGDLAGQWVLEGLATPATYQVVVSRRGFAAQTLIVELDGGQDRTGVDATLVADLGTIVGRVTDASPDPNSPGVAQGVGALNVTLAGPEARETRTLTVDGDLRGTFDLPGLPFGDYQITFSGDGWVTRQAEVTVDSGLVRLDTTIDRSTGLVQGWVWQNATTEGAFQGECRYPRQTQRDTDEAAFQPCGGVSVSVTSDDGDLFATASADGTGFFQVAGVPAGEYTLTLSRAGYVSHVRSIRVPPGGTVDLNPDRVAGVTVTTAEAARDFIPLGLAAPPTSCVGTVLLTLLDQYEATGRPPLTPIPDGDIPADGPSIIRFPGASGQRVDSCDDRPTVNRIGASATFRIAGLPLGSLSIEVGDDTIDPSELGWAYRELAEPLSVQLAGLDPVPVSTNLVPRFRPLTLPAGAVTVEGPERTVSLDVVDAAGQSRLVGGRVDVTVAAGANVDPIALAGVVPDRNLRLRAVGTTTSDGYDTVTAGDSFELEPLGPGDLATFDAPVVLDELTGSQPLTVVATTQVSGTIFGFSASPLELTPIEAKVTFPASSRATANTDLLEVTTAADGTFSTTVRAGTFRDGGPVDRTGGTFGAIEVSATGYDTRVFEPAPGRSLLGPTNVLREGEDFFLLYAGVDAAQEGDVGLDPDPRTVTVPVELLGAGGTTEDRLLEIELKVDPDGDSVARPTSGARTADATIVVGATEPVDVVFADVLPGDYEVTVTGDGARGATVGFTVPVGTGGFTAPSVQVQATVEVTVIVEETVVLGDDESLKPVGGATVTATAPGVSEVTGVTADEGAGAGQVTLTLDSGVTYEVEVAKPGYTPAESTLEVGAARTQELTVPLPTGDLLRVFGSVSASVESVRVVGGDIDRSEVVVDGSYSFDGLPTGTLYQVDFLDEGEEVLVSRWIQEDRAENVSIQLDQDAEPAGVGSIIVTVVVPEAPDGAEFDTPDEIEVRLIEDVPAGFYSISEDGVLVGDSDEYDTEGATFTVVFDRLRKDSTSGSLPPKRFTVAMNDTRGDGLVPTGYVLLGDGALGGLDVGAEPEFKLATIAGAPEVETIETSSRSLSVVFAPTTDGGGTITNYEFSTDGGTTWRPRGDGGGDSSPLVISGQSDGEPLKNGTEYHVLIRAVNEAGPGLGSAPSPAIPMVPAPTGVTSERTPDVDGSITVTWTEVEEADTYTVKVLEDGDVVDERPLEDGEDLFCEESITTPKSLTVPGTTCRIEGLFDGNRSYEFEVVSKDGDDESAPSGRTTPALKPAVATTAASFPGACAQDEGGSIIIIECTGVGEHQISFTSIAEGATIAYTIVGGGGGGMNDGGGGGGGGAVVNGSGVAIGGMTTALTVVVGDGGDGGVHGAPDPDDPDGPPLVESSPPTGGGASRLILLAGATFEALGGEAAASGAGRGPGGAGGEPGGGQGGDGSEAGDGATMGADGALGEIRDVRYGGGGGGGSDDGTAASGGSGGGGVGGSTDDAAGDGDPNTGGGGGGGATGGDLESAQKDGGSGGSGVVVIRLVNP